MNEHDAQAKGAVAGGESVKLVAATAAAGVAAFIVGGIVLAVPVTAAVGCVAYRQIKNSSLGTTV